MLTLTNLELPFSYCKGQATLNSNIPVIPPCYAESYKSLYSKTTHFFSEFAVPYFYIHYNIDFCISQLSELWH